jgi:hypothetical protein
MVEVGFGLSVPGLLVLLQSTKRIAVDFASRGTCVGRFGCFPVAVGPSLRSAGV